MANKKETFTFAGDMNTTKQQLRRKIAELKKSYPADTLAAWSEQILQRLEQTRLFQQAETIACYHALPGEVQTASLLERWYRKKKLLLPLVQGDDLLLLPYAGAESVQVGAYGIWEPRLTAEKRSMEQDAELIIVPGVAFDRQLNRLGRGKGFYDRLLSTLNVPKIGLCYAFQLQEEIPTEPFDRKMDWIVTEKELLPDHQIK